MILGDLSSVIQTSVAQYWNINMMMWSTCYCIWTYTGSTVAIQSTTMRRTQNAMSTVQYVIGNTNWSIMTEWGQQKKWSERIGQAVHWMLSNKSYLATWSLFCMKCLWGRFMIWIWWRVARGCNVSQQGIAMCHNMLQCVTTCCNVSQCVATCCSISQRAKFVMWEAAMKEKFLKLLTNTDNNVCAQGAQPAYQQDFLEPQNEGGRGSGACWGARGHYWNNC